jgi:hypothetical protein
MAIKVRMLCNWFDGGELLFKAGELYEESPATLAQVKRGNAQRVDAPAEPAAPEAEADADGVEPELEPDAPAEPAASVRPGRKAKA